jgi:hypothetical protein
VVVGRRLHGDRVVPGRGGFVVAESGAGDDQVEDLDHLGAEAAGEAGPAADRVSPATRPCLWAVGPSGR